MYSALQCKESKAYITHEYEVAVEKINHLMESLLATIINGSLMCRPLMLCQEFILQQNTQQRDAIC